VSIGPVNPWAAFTVNSPHGVSLGALPNGGANALLALLVTYEQTGGTRPDVSASIGGQSATLRAVYHVSGATNFNGVDVFIWNAAKIAAMSGSSIALSGANGYPAPSTNNGVQWTWAMLRDVDQAAPTLTPGFKSGNSATTTIDNPAPPASDYSIIAACSSAESNNFTTAPANHSETLDTAAGFHLAGLWEGLGISSGSRVVTQNATSTRICCSQLGFNEDIAASPPVLATITQNPQEGDTITTTGSNLQSAVLELDGVEQTPIDNSGGSGGTYTCVLGDNRYDVALDAEVTTGAGTDTLEDEVTIAPPDNSQLLLTVAPLADPAERIPGVTAAGQQVLLYDPTGDFEDIPGDVTGYTNGAFSTIAGDGTFKSKVHGSVWSTPETNTVEDPPVEAPPTFDGPDIDDVRYELGEAITPLDLSGRFSDAGEFGLFRLGATLGSSLATGAGAASTALVLEDGTDFDPGRYVIIGTGFPIAGHLVGRHGGDAGRRAAAHHLRPDLPRRRARRRARRFRLDVRLLHPRHQRQRLRRLRPLPRDRLRADAGCHGRDPGRRPRSHRRHRHLERAAPPTGEPRHAGHGHRAKPGRG